MFLGIIEQLGTIKSIINSNQNLLIEILLQRNTLLKIGDSVAVNGICLTVVHITGKRFAVEACYETQKLTNVKYWKVEDTVNLEEAATLSKPIGGHILQGHVEYVSKIINIEVSSGSHYYTFNNDKSINKYIVYKGYIAIDGASLTVVEINNDIFKVAIIPYTLANTLFKNYVIGNKVNIETDIYGKYVVKNLELSNRKG